MNSTIAQIFKSTLVGIAAMVILGCADPLDMPVTPENNSTIRWNFHLSFIQKITHPFSRLSNHEKEKLRLILRGLESVQEFNELEAWEPINMGNLCWFDSYYEIRGELKVSDGLTYRDLLDLGVRYEDSLGSLLSTLAQYCPGGGQFVTNMATYPTVAEPRYSQGRFKGPLITILNNSRDVIRKVTIAWTVSVKQSGEVIGSGLEDYTFGRGLMSYQESVVAGSWSVEHENDYANAQRDYGSFDISLIACVQGVDGKDLYNSGADILNRKQSDPNEPSLPCLDTFRNGVPLMNRLIELAPDLRQVVLEEPFLVSP